MPNHTMITLLATEGTGCTKGRLVQYVDDFTPNYSCRSLVCLHECLQTAVNQDGKVCYASRMYLYLVAGVARTPSEHRFP